MRLPVVDSRHRYKLRPEQIVMVRTLIEAEIFCICILHLLFKLFLNYRVY